MKDAHVVRMSFMEEIINITHWIGALVTSRALIGVADTPQNYFATGLLKASGGIQVTASHNPQPWNALKLLQGSGHFLTAEQFEDFGAYRVHYQALPSSALSTDVARAYR